MLLRTRLRILRWLIVRAVPALNRFRKPTGWSLTVSHLSGFPQGSWGLALARFLRVRRFDFLPQYEAHDALHCLLNYGTTASGELRLQAFMCGNRSATVAGRVLLLLGLCRCQSCAHAYGVSSSEAARRHVWPDGESSRFFTSRSR